MLNKQLPDKPSELIELALSDLKKVEKDRKYRVNMASWHIPNPYVDVCYVCLAGSVMAKSLNVPKGDWYPSDLGVDIDAKLIALDAFRKGHISVGLVRLGYTLHPLDSGIIVKCAPYDINRSQFYKDMKLMAKTFRKLGL